ncbi:osmiophilic body protein [Plasmodium berghei]|uniref:Osmiophilic body protein G377 n=2 Tax=Plasmodium berghei TaxID=5821 RepID=A0A509B231_PLABA|nr:osmiophilic body protein G377 [Plasmodium berghei ANKA]CXJ29507.1 osmiophilic body protein [Plasmodium berghei]SCM27085.1 osmiophilic body protein [Plasmodium berghei]SCN28811.1 osmiophilic body protein [Plasmodium berghei]SCO63109.1 osmiophilic body protein [Plasmodium berghei]SCO64558.1 osmiophilic body protein [Plasmodium berghei]|eukprot:XP_034424457.1 osmiophilic body protein G377 [Plasmodium berghei ANKA]
MKILLYTFLFCICSGFAKCQKAYNFDNIIKYLKEIKVIPSYIPDKLEENIQLIPPYLVYKYKNRIYYIHNNVDIYPVINKKPKPVFPIDPDDTYECTHNNIKNTVDDEVEEDDDTVDINSFVPDNETGMFVPNINDIKEQAGTSDEFEIPKNNQVLIDQNGSNAIVNIFETEGCTNYLIGELVEFRKNKEICENIKTEFEIFNKDNIYEYNEQDEKTPTHNIEISDFYTFLNAIHILFHEDEYNKYYTINNVSVKDIKLFIKEAYINIHNSLKTYILFSGLNFSDYTYSPKEFSIDALLNDFFHLTNDSNDNMNGSFENIERIIKYVATSKSRLTIKLVENAIINFLDEQNLMVLDIKLISHIFSTNRILNYNENDIIKYAADLVNISEIDISPRIISTIFIYFAQKVNIFPMPNYPTSIDYDSLLFLENNDLLANIENIYNNFFKHFYRHSNSTNKGKKGKSHEQILQTIPWAEQIYSKFKTTHDLLSFKYGVILFYNSYVNIMEYLSRNKSIKDIIEKHKENKQIGNLDQFINELIKLLQIAPPESNIVKETQDAKETLPIFISLKDANRHNRRVLSDDLYDSDIDEIDSHEMSEDNDTPDENNKYLKELKITVENELIEERKKYVLERNQEKQKKEQFIKKEIEEIDKKHELETQKLEKEEPQKEILQDEQIDREYENGLEDETIIERDRLIALGKENIRSTVDKSKRYDKMYYELALKTLTDDPDEVYGRIVKAGYGFASKSEQQFQQIVYTLNDTTAPKYDELKADVFRSLDKSFNTLLKKIKNQKNITKSDNLNSYKKDVESYLNTITKKNPDGKYYMCIEDLMVTKFNAYKKELMNLCDKKFYGNFRKSLSKHYLKMMREFRITLKNAIRLAQDLAASYDQNVYIPKFTNIYTEKKNLYKTKYAEDRRKISKHLDKSYRNMLNKHYKKKQRTINKELQKIKKYVINHINGAIKVLYNTVYTELQIDKVYIFKQINEININVSELSKENESLNIKLANLEADLQNIPNFDSKNFTAKKETINKGITNVKENIKQNIKKINDFKDQFNSLSTQHDIVVKKINTIHEIEKKLRLFKYDIEKSYKNEVLNKEIIVDQFTHLRMVYKIIQDTILDLFNELYDIENQHIELKIDLEILTDNYNDKKVQVSVLEKLYQSQLNTKESNIENLVLQKTQLTKLENQIKILKTNIDKLKIKREIILNEVNYITSDSARNPPHTINYLKKFPLEPIIRTNTTFEKFMEDLIINLEIDNQIYQKFIKIVKGYIRRVPKNAIFSFKYLENQNKKKIINEKYYQIYRKGLNIFVERLYIFHSNLKNYIDAKKKKNIPNILPESGKKTNIASTQSNEISYLERNIIHIENILNTLKANVYIPDISYIITKPEYFLNEIKNEDPENARRYKDLLNSYTQLKDIANNINIVYEKMSAYNSYYKHASERILRYRASLKFYHEVSDKIYYFSFRNEQIRTAVIDGKVVTVDKYGKHIKPFSMLQYINNVIEDVYDKDKYLSVIKEETMYPFPLKPLKDIYILGKTLKYNLLRNNQLSEFKTFVKSKMYTIIEKNDNNPYIFDKDELDKLKIIKNMDETNNNTNLIEGSLKNFFSHYSDIFQGIDNNIHNLVENTINELLKKNGLSYNALLEIIKYLKEKPNILRIKEIILLCERILNKSNLHFINPDKLAFFFVSILEAFDIKVLMTNVKRNDNKSTIISYLNLLKMDHKKGLVLSNYVKDFILRFLKPKENNTQLKYNPKLFEFLESINHSLDGNGKMYELFKNKNPEFNTQLLSSIKNSLDAFLKYFIPNIINTHNIHGNFLSYYEYNKKETETFLFNKNDDHVSDFNRLLSFFLFSINSEVRKLHKDHINNADIKCLKEHPHFNFADLIPNIDDDKINYNFNKYMSTTKTNNIQPIMVLFRLFFHPKNKDLFTYSNVINVVEKFFTSNIFDNDTKKMIGKLAYSLMARLSFIVVSYLEPKIEDVIDGIDINLMNLFHSVINKIVYTLYCKNNKEHLEPFIPTSMIKNDKVFKLDALKIYNEFLMSLPEQDKRSAINFFQTDFPEVVTTIISDALGFVNHHLEKGPGVYHSDEYIKLETLFKINYKLSSNNNLYYDNFDEFIQKNPEFTQSPNLLFMKKAEYDNTNKKIIYKNELNLEDIIDEKSFGLLTEELFKEHLTIKQVNDRFTNIMKKLKFLMPKMHVFKDRLDKSGNQEIEKDIYEYIYKRFKHLNLSYSIQGLVYIPIKKIIDFILFPSVLVQNVDADYMTMQLDYRYNRYIKYIDELTKCLIDIYYYNKNDSCLRFGNYTKNEISIEQKVVNLMQTPFIETLEENKNNFVYNKYISDNDDIFYYFINKLLPINHNIEKNKLSIQIFKIKYFVLEITKFVIKKALSTMPSSYLTKMTHRHININIDHIINSLYSLYAKANKTKTNEQQHQNTGTYAHTIGSIINFMYNANDDLYDFEILDEFKPEELIFDPKEYATEDDYDEYDEDIDESVIKKPDESEEEKNEKRGIMIGLGGKQKVKNIKLYLNNYISEFLLNNNISFKYLYQFIQNMDKFKAYLPTLSELYIFIDKHVNIINSIYSSYYIPYTQTDTIINIFVDTFKALGLDIYSV